MRHIRLKTTAAPAVVKLAVDCLRAGGVAVLPTDTIYGLSGLATSRRAIARIQNLKRREANKPFILLVSDLAMAKRYALISKKQGLILRRYWLLSRRPTTVILDSRGLLPRSFKGADKSLALRLPKSVFLTKIVRAAGAPLISTSLNISGQESIRDLRLLPKVWPSKKSQPDLVIDAGVNRRIKPSRLIDLRDPEKPVVLRA